MKITKTRTSIEYDNKLYTRFEYPSGLMWTDSDDHELYCKSNNDSDWKELIDYHYENCAVPKLEILYQQAIKQLPKQPDYTDLITALELNLI
jgi:hypothetical protein